MENTYDDAAALSSKRRAGRGLGHASSGGLLFLSTAGKRVARTGLVGGRVGGHWRKGNLDGRDGGSRLPGGGGCRRGRIAGGRCEPCPGRARPRGLRRSRGRCGGTLFGGSLNQTARYARRRRRRA